MTKYLLYVWISVLIAGIHSEDCRTNFKCVLIAECTTSHGDFILYPCESGKPNMICCPPELTHLKNDTANSTKVISRTSQFPVNCGIVYDDDRITGGHNASVGQFPWMALLGYKQKSIEFTQFLCAGSIITDTYILTAAHCLNLPNLELVLVRLGEMEINENPDCETILNLTICAEPHVEVLVSKIQVHEGFNTVTLKNDIALVKMQRKVTFTEWIQPICLPFDVGLKRVISLDGKMTISGWGKTSSDNLGGSTNLQYTMVAPWDKDKCNLSVPPEVRPIKDKQICANGQKKEDACKGDSGGPLFNATVEGNNVKTYQFGIVSFASAQICGNPDLPTIYTKVDAYMTWIVQNVK